jgi:adenosine deaminase CECR1
MSTANTNEKKRKRSSRSLRSSSRIAPKIAESQVPLPGSNFDMEGHEAVWDHFKANKSRSKDNVQKRTALVQAEIADSWDHSMIDQKNKTEKDAATIVQVLRKYERKFVFGNLASEAVPGPDTRDMGGQFLTNKVRIEKNSELFNISKEVPKGAILHLHYNAELNPERLLIEARKMPNMYVWSIRPLLSQKDLDETEMQFKIMPADTKSNNIFSGQYMSGLGESRGKKIKPLDTIRPLNHDNFKNRVWMRWDEFRDRFEVEFPGLYKQSQENKNDNQRSRTCSDPDDVELKPAEYWMMQKMILSEKEAYEPAQTVNGYVGRLSFPLAELAY